MQYNIFKINKKEKLLQEMQEKKYYTNNKTIKSGDFELTLYYNKIENTAISWHKVLSEFGINVQVDKESLKGIMLADNGDEMYAVTYGMSSSLVQKYCDSDFPMDIAKKINVSKVKRKAAKILNGSTNSLVKTLSNSNFIVVDKGESVVNLELVPDDKENLGKCIGIGKSLRINSDKELDCFCEIVNILNGISKREEQRPIPLLLKVKNDELVENIWNNLNIDFASKINSLNYSLDEMNILGSSIYFDDIFKIELFYINKHEEVPCLNSCYVKKFIEKHNIDSTKVLNHLKIKYLSDSGGSFVKSFKEIITFDFGYNNEQYVIYDGFVYYYNADFYKNIVSGVKSILFEKYDQTDDKSKTWYKNYLEKSKLFDIRDKNKTKGNSTYREKVINETLAKKYDYENLDTKFANICKEESYKIEIADLGNKQDVIYAVKVGTPRDFCYAIDQSNLILDIFSSSDYKKDELVKKYKNVKKIGLWLYVTGKKKFYDSNNDINIINFDSIMFLNKLVEWSSKVYSAGYIPVVKMNYYKDE